MKSLKMKILIFASLIFMLILNLNPISYATDASSNPKYIGITELKTESEIGYAIGNPNNQGAKIWNLVEYQNATSNTYSENNLYCLKAGVGFENVDKRATYDIFYDMKQEKEDIAKENEILKNLVEGTIELENGTTISQYSAILDMFYYDGVSNESYKENLLNAAEILYKYLINAAKEKASEYDNIASNTTAPIQLDTQKLNYEIQGSRTIIGPIHITKNNIKSYNLEFITKIGNSETSDYILLDQNKSQVLEGTTVEDLIGEDFYVSLLAESTLEKTISIEVNIEYDETNFTLWASNTNADEQPVVIPKKEEISKPGKLEIEIPNLMGEYNLEILKVDQENGEEPLEGAEFKITLADGTEKTGRTNAEGKIEIEGIEIKEEGTETIKIEETKAPEGYNKIFNSVELEVTKEIQNGGYVVSKIELKNAEGTGLIEGELKANLENGKITVTVPNKKVEGSYELEIVKKDKDRGTKLSGAVFNVNGEDKEATNSDGIVNIGTFQITDTSTPDRYTIKETSSPEGYNKFEGSIELSVAKTIQDGVYVVDTENTTMVVKDSEGTEITENIPVTIDKTTGKITITVDNVKKEFDLALRKFIVAVSRDETIEEDEYLRNEDGSYTREPVLVQKNDIVIYMLRVYNEGDIDGYAAEIKDHLPPYLEYVEGEFNNQYGWEVSEDGRTLTTRYLENSLINKPVVNEEGAYELSYQEVPVMCRVIESAPTNENITNIADITEYQDDQKEETIDRD